MTGNLAASSATDKPASVRHASAAERNRKHTRDVDVPASPSDDAASLHNASSAAHPLSPGVAATANSTTNFRNVSACNRCRNRKSQNRCDQKLPKCSNCVKARVDCVGFDPVSKREIPRSYVYYLETRVHSLESILTQHGINFPAPREDFSISETIKPGINVPFPIQDEQSSPSLAAEAIHDADAIAIDPVLTEADEGERLKKLVSKVGVVPTQSASESQYANNVSNITFAKVVFAAVKRTRQQTPSPSERSSRTKPQIPDLTGGGTTMRDSFFGLHTKPTIKAAPFPRKNWVLDSPSYISSTQILRSQFCIGESLRICSTESTTPIRSGARPESFTFST
ncbi:hypothetical protein MRB53_041309 [Persea americana]|nr:hypothetical protein MRB53_041309 [Persea americana]